jgi:2'-5' RNA ligase
MSGSATEPESPSEPSLGNTGGAIEFYALVAYLPEPIAGFLAGLRHELDPHFLGRPHLTILPPRPLRCSSDAAWKDVRRHIALNHPISVGLGNVETFPGSRVIFVSLSVGEREVEILHEHLNAGRVNFLEAWQFHPHVTLAHGVPEDRFSMTSQIARVRWAEYSGPRTFSLTRLDWAKTEVQTDPARIGQPGLVQSDTKWTDLEHCDLGAPPIDGLSPD